MLNSAASALVDSNSAGTVKGEIIGRNIASEYGNVESNTETVKEQLHSLNIKNKDKNADSPRHDKMTSQISAGEENGYVKQSQFVENVAKRKQISPSAQSTERGKRVLPATPKSLYSTPSQSSSSLNQPAENVTLHSKRLSTSSLSSNTTSSLSSEDDLSRSKTKQTHIAVYKFVARHDDEINLETGDAVCVNKKCEDLWFEGINLRTGEAGCFPSRYVSDILRGSVQDNSVNESQVNQFSVRFLGSVEVNGFKGNDIICDAMKEIVRQHQLTSTPKPPACILDVSERGIRIIEHPQALEGRKGSVSLKKSSKRKLGKIFDRDSKEMSAQSHYFALKNVTFCGCHPQNARFFAFITKHPEDHRFACHVFMSEYSTEPVANAVGCVFKKFYPEFLDYQPAIVDF
ncbi:C-Jun-amino-terminal kinase-interacting protein 1-like isoform X2 [Oculina patagonica]